MAALLRGFRRDFCSRVQRLRTMPSPLATVSSSAPGAHCMKRRAPVDQRFPTRRHRACWIGLSLLACAGCMNPILRQQSPEASLDLPPTPDVPLIAEYTHPYGMNYIKVEAVSLVTGLAGNGSHPPPPPPRATP